MHQKRRIKLIKPTLQLKLTLIFVGISALSLLLQGVLLMSGLTRAALDLPNDHLIMLDQVNSIVFGALVSSFALFLPLTFAVGILTTFRLAGPLFRLERFLRQTIRGDKPADCQLRKGDELHGFCALINEVTAPLRTEDDIPAQGTQRGNDPESVPSLTGGNEATKVLDSSDAPTETDLQHRD
ncbi:MAG: hypothetical protein ACI8QZ_001078 [Chlamydiales bacterium]|jgi:hypothetical protein